MDGSGSNTGAINLYCRCHGEQRMAVLHPEEGIEIISRHHGTYHTGSLSLRGLLESLAGTVDGSAIVAFVQRQIIHG